MVFRYTCWLIIEFEIWDGCWEQTQCWQPEKPLQVREKDQGADSQEEDRKNHEQRMQVFIDQLQGKIKSYKMQMDEAEEIAALNLAKFHKAKTNLAIRANERAD